MDDIWTIERTIKQCQRLINHMLGHKDEIHTEKSLARFFRFQNVKSRLDHLVDLGILERQTSGIYTVSQDQVVHDVIKRVNDKTRAVRNLIDFVISQFF